MSLSIIAWFSLQLFALGAAAWWDLRDPTDVPLPIVLTPFLFGAAFCAAGGQPLLSLALIASAFFCLILNLRFQWILAPIGAGLMWLAGSAFLAIAFLVLYFLLYQLHILGEADLLVILGCLAISPSIAMALALFTGFFLVALFWVVVRHRLRIFHEIGTTIARLFTLRFPTDRELSEQGPSGLPGALVGFLLYVILWLAIGA